MLALKLILVPTLIGLISLAGRRWGPDISGLLAGLPWTSGPVLLFLAVENGQAFAAEAALGILTGVLSVTAFCFAYAWAATRVGWLMCATAGLVGYFLATSVLVELRLERAAAFAVVVLVLTSALLAMPRGGRGSADAQSIPWEIPLRMAAATTLVVALTGLAHLLGPRLAGLLAPFPVYASVLAIFAHRTGGTEPALDTLSGVVRGSFSFAVFFLVAAIDLEALGLGYSLAAAGASALSLHVLLLHAHAAARRSQTVSEMIPLERRSGTESRE